MLFRFWLFTSLIVAFVAYIGAFGTWRTPAGEDHPGFRSPSGLCWIPDDDVERGR